MKKLYIVKTGTTFAATNARYGDFDDWTVAALGATDIPLEVIDAKMMPELPSWRQCAGVTVTGAHEMVTERLPWSAALEPWIAELVENKVPFFGVCYGHQLLAQATGGEVGYHPQGQEIGTELIERLPSCDNDPLCADFPPQFYGQTTHSQSVLTLPLAAVRLAANSFEPNHAFRLGECAWGVQFHPEYTGAIMTSYIEEQAASLRTRGRDVPGLISAVRETPDAAALYRRFTRFVEETLTTA